MPNIKRWIIYFIALFGMSAGDALAIKADIGVAPLEALELSFTGLTMIKVGTIAIIINCIFIFIQMFILKKEFKKTQYLQFVISFIAGFMVNFWLYDVYSFEVSTYWVRIILLLLSYVITTIFLGVIVSLDIITMPLEALCMIISKSFNKSFTKLRQLSDVINTVISVLMSLIFHLSFSVREGSVLAMIIFAPMLGYFMKYEKPILSKNNLIDNSNVEKHTA